MQKTVQVIDDFYSGPERVREMALDRGRWSPQKTDDGLTFDAETENSFYSKAVDAAAASLLHPDRLSVVVEGDPGTGLDRYASVLDGPRAV